MGARSPSDACREGERLVRALLLGSRLREVVVRVRHLERLVREAALEIAELVAQVGDDVVALRLDVGARPGLVLESRTGPPRVDVRPAELRLVEVGRVRADRRLGGQAVGEAAVTAVDR